MALFWADLELSRARQNVRQILYNLRAVLGECREALIVDAVHVELSEELAAVDVVDFERTAREGLAGRGPAALASLSRAMDLYRGQLLAGLALPDAEAWEEWRTVERTRLLELARRAAREALRRSEADGLHETALRFARRLSALDQLSEEACRARMRLLTRLGRRAEALRAYQDFAALLRRELELDPGADLRTLRESIESESSLPGADADRPGPTGPVVELVGRDSVRRDLDGVWREIRAGESQVTLVLGPRGAGKSRLIRTFVYQAMAGREGTVLLARCQEKSDDPWRSLLAQVVASVPVGSIEQSSAELTRALGACVTCMPEVQVRRRDLPLGVAPSGSDPLHAVAALLRELAKGAAARSSRRDSPVVLFVDDLEHAPELVGRLVDLRRAVGRAPVWVLGAARSGEPAPSGLGALQVALDRERGRILELQNLSEMEILQAAEALVGRDQAGVLASALFAASAGLPMALAESVNLLADEGELRQEQAGRWVLANPGRIETALPNCVAALIDRRLALLPKTSRRLLGLAAVVGERFDTSTLLEVDHEHPAVLEVALRLLIERWFVRPFLGAWVTHRRDRDLAVWQAGARQGPFEFAQRTVRDRLIEIIEPARRWALEDRIAQAELRLREGRRGE